MENYKDKTWLYEQYVILKKSTSQIARECNKSYDKVYYRLKENKIPMRTDAEGVILAKCNKSYMKYNWLYEQYVKLRKSTHQIARENNTNKGAVLHWLRKHNIERRSKSEALTGKKLSSVHRAKLKENSVPFPTGSAHPNWIGGFMTTNICKVCEEEFDVRKDVVKRGLGKFCSRSCSTIYRLKNGMVKSDTKIEQIIENWLNEKHIKYEKQEAIRYGTCWTLVDFFVKPNICIYCDGDYWHSRPEAIERDKRQNEGLKKLGYQVIRLKGSEIKSGKRPEITCS